MPSKPMTDYINHKYPVAEKPIQSVLTQVNEILTRVSNIERELSDMRITANNIGIVSASLVVLRTADLCRSWSQRVNLRQIRQKVTIHLQEGACRQTKAFPGRCAR